MGELVRLPRRVDRAGGAVPSSARVAEAGGDKTDEELMLLYIAGDAGAFQQLFRRVAPMLLRVAERQLGRGADAQDCVQQAFLQVHRARKDFKVGTKLRPWLVTIVLNLARDNLRRRGRWLTSDIDDVPLAAPDQSGAAREAADAAVQVRAALDRLPHEQRTVIELHWFEEMPFADIAQALGSTAGAVRVRAHRGYTTLRKLLGADKVPAGDVS